MPVPSQGHYGFHSFPVVDWFFLFIYIWVLTFPLLDCSEFGNFVITLIILIFYWSEIAKFVPTVLLASLTEVIFRILMVGKWKLIYHTNVGQITSSSYYVSLYFLTLSLKGKMDSKWLMHLPYLLTDSNNHQIGKTVSRDFANWQSMKIRNKEWFNVSVYLFWLQVVDIHNIIIFCSSIVINTVIVTTGTFEP